MKFLRKMASIVFVTFLLFTGINTVQAAEDVSVVTNNTYNTTDNTVTTDVTVTPDAGVTVTKISDGTNDYVGGSATLLFTANGSYTYTVHYEKGGSSLTYDFDIVINEILTNNIEIEQDGVKITVENANVEVDFGEKPMFNIMIQNVPGSTIDNGVLDIRVPGKLTIPYYEETAGNFTVTYLVAQKQIIANLANGFAAQDTYSFSVEPSVTASAGDTLQIPVTFTGTNDGTPINITFNLNVKIKNSSTPIPYVEATAAMMTEYFDLASYANKNYSGYAGASHDMYAALAYLLPGKDAVHFSNLIIVRESDPVTDSWWVDPVRQRITLVDGIANRLTPEWTQEANGDYKFQYGELITDYRIVFFESRFNVPVDAAPGNYVLTYHVYNDTEFLFTSTVTVEVKNPGAQITYTSRIHNGGKATIGDQIAYQFKFGMSSGPGDTTDIVLEYEIPVELELIDFFVREFSVSKMEYTTDGISWTTIGVGCNQACNFSEITAGALVSGLRIHVVDVMNIERTTYANLILKNRSLADGTTAQIKLKSLNYRVSGASSVVDHVSSTPGFSSVRTVTGVAATNSPYAGTSKIKVGVKEYNSDATFPTDQVFTGQKFVDSVRIGNIGGSETDNAFIYVIVPNGLTATRVSAGGSSVYIGLTGIEDGADIMEYRMPSYTYRTGAADKYGSIALSGDRTMYYIISTNTSLSGYDGLVNFLLGRFQFEVKTLQSGVYDVVYGTGSLTDDGYIVVEDNGMVKTNFTAELQTALGNVSGVPVTANTHYTTTKQLTVGDAISITPTIKAQGEKDSSPVLITGKDTHATTLPTKEVTFIYDFTNNGTMTYKNLEIIDILPHKNDKYITNGNNRNSAFDVNATNKIKVSLNGKATNDVVVYYSTSNLPERFDGNGATVAGDSWVLSGTMTDMSTVRSIKVVLNIDFKPGDVLTLEFTGQLSNDVPRDGVSTAYNSIAYRADMITGTGALKRTALEPNPAAVQADLPQGEGEFTGVVYNDLNSNGVNNSEPGLNGVEIELYVKNGANWDLLDTATTTIDSGVHGSFAFVNDIEHGDYKLRIKLPSGGIFTLNAATGYGLILDSTDNEYAWVTYNGNEIFVVNDLDGTNNLIYSGIEIPIFSYTPLKGTVVFVKKDGTPLTSDYAQGSTINLYDGANLVASAIVGTGGVYQFNNLKITSTKAYSLEFVQKNAGEFVACTTALCGTYYNTFTSGKLDITLVPGTGISTGDVTDFYITDNINPSPTISPTFSVTVAAVGYNPTIVMIASSEKYFSMEWDITLDGESSPEASGVETSTPVDLAQYFNALITAKKSGRYIVSVKVTDAAGNVGNISLGIMVMASDPTIVATATKTYELESTATVRTKAILMTDYGISATDGLGNTISSDNISVDASAVKPNVVGTYDVIITATDIVGNTNTKTIQYSVTDTVAPVINSVTTSVIEFNYGDTIDKDSILAKIGTIGYTEISGTPTYSIEGINSLVLTDLSTTGQKVNLFATDASNNKSAAYEITIKIVDKVKPEFVITNTVIEKDFGITSYTLAQLITDVAVTTLSDNYSTLTTSDIMGTGFSGLVFTNDKINVVQQLTLSVKDSSGNETKHDIDFKLVDKVKPIITTTSTAVTYRSGTTVSRAKLFSDIGFNVADNSGLPVTNITTDLSQIDFTKDHNPSQDYTITITATDDFGNAETVKVTVTMVRMTTYHIEGDDVTITVNDLNKLLSDPDLEEKVLKLANVKAWKDDAIDGITNLEVGIKDLTVLQNPKVSDTIDVVMTMTQPLKPLARTSSQSTDSTTLSHTIHVKVVSNPFTPSPTPNTGVSASAEIWLPVALVGLLLLIVGLKKKQNKEG